MANLVLARVTTPRGVYANGVLHLQGEQLYVDLDELGIESLDDAAGLAPGTEGDGIATAAIASFAPRAPGATAPQGLPSGTRISGTGRQIMPTGEGENASGIEPVADLLLSELEPEAPIRRDDDIEPLPDDEITADDEAAAIKTLVDGNSKDQLLATAEADGVTGVTVDNNKTEIATKIVQARKG